MKGLEPMGQIIPFPRTEAEARSSCEIGEGCHVMIFPGVRIERHEEMPEPEREGPSRTGT